jgi:hypothetical protein
MTFPKVNLVDAINLINPVDRIDVINVLTLIVSVKIYINAMNVTMKIAIVITMIDKMINNATNASVIIVPV